MTDEAPHVHELVAAYVLGAVTALEQERVESHLTRCATCRDQERALRAVAVLLPADAAPVGVRIALSALIYPIGTVVFRAIRITELRYVVAPRLVDTRASRSTSY